MVAEENAKSLRLYDWQRRGIDFFFEHNCKAIYSSPTGAGKTIFAIELLQRIFDKDPKANVLVIVPKNIILEDTWYKSLIEAGYSIRDVGVFYAGIKECAKITLTNVQNIQDINLNKFDVAIMDEVHHIPTKRIMKILYARDKMFPYMIGLSATPERYDLQHHELFKIFDYNVFQYTPEEALHDGILNPFDFYDIAIEMDDEAREEYDDITQKINTLLQSIGGNIRMALRSSSPVKFQLFGLMNQRKDLIANYPRKLDAVKAICIRHTEDKVIVFNEYNKQTEATYWHLLDGGVRACTMHSGIPTERRRENIAGFISGRYNVMLASKVLDEGWNFPACDVAIIAAGESSSRQTIQRMGRVLRKKKTKSILYQLFVYDTIEQKHAEERGKLFRSLCSDFREFMIGMGEDLGTMWGS